GRSKYEIRQRGHDATRADGYELLAVSRRRGHRTRNGDRGGLIKRGNVAIAATNQQYGKQAEKQDDLSLHHRSLDSQLGFTPSRGYVVPQFSGHISDASLRGMMCFGQPL